MSSDSSDGFSASRLRKLATADKARREVPRIAPRKAPLASDSDSDVPLLTPARRTGGLGKQGPGTAGRSVAGGRLAALARSARRSSSSSSSDGEEQRFRSSVQQLAARAVQQRRQQQQHMSGSASVASSGLSDDRAPAPPANVARKRWVPRGPLSSDDDDDYQQRLDTRPRRDAAAHPQPQPRHAERPQSPATRPPVHASSAAQADTRGAGMASKSSSFRGALASLRTVHDAGASSAAAGAPSARGASGAASPVPGPVSTGLSHEHSGAAKRTLLHTASMPARTEQIPAGSGLVPARAESPRGSPAPASHQGTTGGVDPVGMKIRHSLSVALEQPLGSPSRHGQESSPGAAPRHLGLPSPSVRTQQPKPHPQGSSGSTSPQRPLSPSRLHWGPGASLPEGARKHTVTGIDASSAIGAGHVHSEDEAGLPGSRHVAAANLAQGHLQQHSQNALPSATRQQGLQTLPYAQTAATGPGYLGSPAAQAKQVGAVPAVALQDAATSPVRAVRYPGEENVQVDDTTISAAAFGPWVAAGGTERGAGADATGVAPSPVRMGALSNTLMREHSAAEVARPDIDAGAARKAATEAPSAAPLAGAMGPAEASSSSPARLDYLPPISHITQQLEELLNHVNSALGHGGAGLGSPATSPLRAGLGASSPVGRFGLGLGPSPGAASQAPTEWYRPASPGLGGLARVLDTAFGRPASPGTGGSPPPPASLAALFPPPPPGADVQSVLRQLATVQRDVDALRRNVMAERAGGVATGSRPGTSGAGGGAGAGSVHFGWTSPPRAGSPGAESPLHGGVAPAAQGPHAPTLQHQRETSSPASYASSVSLLGEQQHPAPPPLARLASPPPSQAQVIRSFGSSFLTSGSLPATLHPGHTAASLRTLAAPPPRRLARIEPLSVVLPSRRRSVSPRAATGMTSPLDNDPQQVEAIVEALGTIRHSLTALGDSVEGLQDIVAAGSSSAGSSPRRPGSRYGRQRRRYSHDELHGGDHSGDWHERGGTGPVDLTGVLPGGRGSRYGSPRRSSEESQRDGIRYEGITDVERRSRSQSRSASPSSSAAGSPRQGRYEVDYGAQGASSRPGSRGRAYAYRTALGATVAHLRAAGGLSPQAGAAAGSGQWPFSQRPQSPTTSPSAARTLQLSPSGAGGRRMHAWDSYLDAGQAAAASPVNGLMVAMPAGKLRVHGSPPRSPSSPSRSRARVLNSSLTAPAAAAGMLAEGRMAPARAGASGGGHTTTTFTPRSQQAAQAAPAAHTFRPAGAMERASPAAAQRTSAAAAAPAATAGAAARGRSSGRPRLMPVEAIVTAFIDAARQAAAIEPLEALPAPNYVRTSGGGYGSPAGSRPPSPGGLPSSALIEDDGLVLTSIVSATAPLERYTAADVLHTLAATPAVPQARGPPASVAASSASDRGSRAAAPASRAHEETRDLHVLLQGMRTLPGAGGGGGSTATAAATGGGGGTTGGRSLSPSLAAMHAETRARLREAGLPVSRLGLAGTAVGAVSAGRLSSTLGGEQRDGGASAAMVGSQAGHAAQRPLAPLSTSSLLASHTPAGSNIRRYGPAAGAQATPSTQPRNVAGASQAGDRRAHILPDTNVSRALATGHGGGVWAGLASTRPGVGPSALRQAGTYSAAPARPAGVSASGPAVPVTGSRSYSSPQVAQAAAERWYPSAATSPAGGNHSAGEQSNRHQGSDGGLGSAGSLRRRTHQDKSHSSCDGDAEQLVVGAEAGWTPPAASIHGSGHSDGAFDGEACAEVGELSFIALAPELRRQALARAGLVSSDQGSVEPPSSDLDSPAWAGEAGMQIDPQHGSGAESSGGEGGGGEGASQEGGSQEGGSQDSGADGDGDWTADQAPADSDDIAQEDTAVVPSEARTGPAGSDCNAEPFDAEHRGANAPSPASTRDAGAAPRADSNQIAAAERQHSQAFRSRCSSPEHEDSASSDSFAGERSIVSTHEHIVQTALPDEELRGRPHPAIAEPVDAAVPQPGQPPPAERTAGADTVLLPQGSGDATAHHAHGPSAVEDPTAAPSAARAEAAQAIEATDGRAERGALQPPHPHNPESELLLTLRAPAPVAAAPAQSGERLRGMLELLTELELVPDPQLDLNPDLHVELGLELGLVSHEALLLGQAGDDGLLGPLALGMAAAAAPSPQVNRMRRPVAAAAHTAEAAGTEAEAIAGVAQMPPGNVLPAQRSLQRALEEDLAAAATPSSVDSGAPCAADEDADVQEEIGSLESAMARAGASPSASTGDTAAGTMPDTDRALGEPGATPVVVPAAAPVQSGARQPLALLQRLHAVAEESRARQQLLLLASPALSLAREHATLANEQASSDGGGASGSSHATDAPGAGIEAAESPAVLVSFGSEQYGSPDKLPNTTSGPAPMDSVADRSPQSAPVDWGELPQAQAAIEPARSAGIPEPADTTALQRRAESHTPDAAAPPAAGTVGCLQPSPVPEPQAPTAAADRTPAGRTAGRMWGLSGGGMAASAAAARSTTPRYAAVPDSPESPAVSSAMAASSGQAGGVVDGSLGEAEDTDSSAGERDEGSSGQGAGGAAAAAPVGAVPAPPPGRTASGPMRERHAVGGDVLAVALQAGQDLEESRLPAGLLQMGTPELHLGQMGAGSGAAPATPTAHGPVHQQVGQVGARSRTLLAGAALRTAALAAPAPPLPHRDAAVGTTAASLGMRAHQVAAPQLSWSLAAQTAAQGQHEPPPAGMRSSGATGPGAGLLVAGRTSFSLAEAGRVLRPRQEPQVRQHPQPGGQPQQQSRASVHGVVPGAAFLGPHVTASGARRAQVAVVPDVRKGSAYATRGQRQSTSLLLASLREINAITQSTCARVFDVMQQQR